jgi:2-oxo-4-hydroxy-4-carboxy-5-ureidoimidazoline decarboxylase
MKPMLKRWNLLPAHEAAEEILACCGAQAWANGLVERRPFENEVSLIAASDEIWNRLGARDWMEAFAKHPRIGERKAPVTASAKSGAWSAQEQRVVAKAAEAVQLALAEGNREYEEKFGRVFIVCATGKSASDMLETLQRRLGNDEAGELREAAEEQRKITNLRLKKWLSE